jgi:hypothetical protein
MNIQSRYSDDPAIAIDPAKVPAEFRHLIPLAKEWSISDDIELDNYIAAASREQKVELVAAFSPHFDELWKWHSECKEIIPQPHELVLFDTAAHAAATVQSMELPEPPLQILKDNSKWTIVAKRPSA